MSENEKLHLLIRKARRNLKILMRLMSSVLRNEQVKAFTDYVIKNVDVILEIILRSEASGGSGPEKLSSAVRALDENTDTSGVPWLNLVVEIALVLLKLAPVLIR